MLKEYMENKYGSDEASKRIYVTTDKSKGALKTLADKEGYETFVIPDDTQYLHLPDYFLWLWRG